MIVSSLTGTTLPVYLDPSIIGIVCNIIAMVIGTALTKVTKEENEARESLFVIPEEEKNPVEIKQTLKWSRNSIWVGVVVFALMLVLWVIPYVNGLR